MTLTQIAGTRGETLHGLFAYAYRRRYQTYCKATVAADVKLHTNFPSYIPEYLETWLVARKINGFAHKSMPHAHA